MGKLFDQATSPSQYDSSDTGFIAEAADLSSPSRAMFWSYLLPFSSDWKDKDLLDIGSGTGWLLKAALDLGVRSATGIEPSKNHVAYARTHFPDTQTIHGQIETLPDEHNYDVAIAIMSLVHVGDLAGFFLKLNEILRSSGSLYTIVPDFEYYRIPRFGYEIKVEELGSDEYAAAITRQTGTIADVVRKTPVYQEAAVKFGFTLLQDMPMKPTQEYIQKFPKYSQFSQTPINRLLIFRKN